MKTSIASCLLSLLSLFACVSAAAEPRVRKEVWTDPLIAQREDPDFAVQGEYAGKDLGMQLVALGGSRFDGYLLEGGLPGAGWEPGKSRRLLKGGREGAVITLKEEAGTSTCVIENSQVLLTEKGGGTKKLNRVERRSPTLGAGVVPGGLALFDGSNTDEWNNGKTENRHLLATDCMSKRRFNSYRLHLEFRTPYMPGARGQARGNSGVYHSGRWETQILDSFGLEGRDNECGGIYSVSKPKLNMCLPPLTWQTYDVEFTAAKFDSGGKRISWPLITVRLNGVLIHENVELAKDFTTSAPLAMPLTSPEGPVFLQNHGDPVAFRNIWVLAGE